MRNGQNGRRRRGGGGGGVSRVPGQGHQTDRGNRMEVRVRGNAHQLLEKYKQLARDASQAGDRVAAEYYLQHADHYFRTLSEFRARQEEQRIRQGGAPQQRDDYDDEDDDFEGAGPLRVAEMTPMGNLPSVEPQAAEADRDGDDEDGDNDAAPQVEAEAIEVPEDRPRRRRRGSRRREDGDASSEMATADA